MGRRPCCLKEGLNRGAWSSYEDKILVDYIKTHGEGKWRDLPAKAGLKRCGKSCRLRWLNYLRPDIKRGNITDDEEILIIKLHKLLGNRWSLIAGRLPGRTDNEIKNYWNTNLSKKVKVLRQQFNADELLHDRPTDNNGMGTLGAEASGVVKPHQVIRAKAVRCTKVYMQEDENSQNLKPLAGKNPTGSILEDIDLLGYLMDLGTQEPISAAPEDHLIPVANNKTGDDSHKSYRDDENEMLLAHFTDLPTQQFDQIIAEGKAALQPEIASELKALASFLDSEEDWQQF